MEKKYSYLLVDASVAPDAFLKTAEAKRLLSSGKCKTAAEAIEKTGISRSAFYKYKDRVFYYNDRTKEKIVTLFFTLDDVTGVLSDILSVIAVYKMNVLTINQNIPINGIANITISLRAEQAELNIGSLMNELAEINGVSKTELLAME